MERARADWSDLREPRDRLPLALAELHRALAPGAVLDLRLPLGGEDHTAPGADGASAHLSAAWLPDELDAVLAGAGLEVDHLETEDDSFRARGRRARTLPDIVGPGMRLLVCGLNPSLYAADRGVGYARPGNRFWAAALDAGLVQRDRDPVHALSACGVGMTDLVKRATVGAAELTAREYRQGAARVEGLVRWLQPGAVCFVGLAGWRAAVDRRAGAGPQPELFGGRPAYVMPSTSGLNAHSSRADLAAHLAAAGRLGAAHRVPGP